MDYKTTDTIRKLIFNHFYAAIVAYCFVCMNAIVTVITKAARLLWPKDGDVISAIGILTSITILLVFIHRLID